MPIPATMLSFSNGNKLSKAMKVKLPVTAINNSSFNLLRFLLFQYEKSEPKARMQAAMAAKSTTWNHEIILKLNLF